MKYTCIHVCSAEVSVCTWVYTAHYVLCCVHLCVFITASLSGAFRKNRLQMLLRIQAQSLGLCLCVCVYVSFSLFVGKRDTEE